MRNAKTRTTIWQAVCTSCEAIAGQGETIAELAAFGLCPRCGRATEPHKQKTVRPKRHHGGLSRKKYLDPETLLKFRKYMREQAQSRNTLRAWTDCVIVEILSRTGLRSGELARTLEHPDRFLRIEDIVFDDKDPAINVVEGKGCVSRVVKIPAGLRDLIAWYISEFRKDAGPDAPLIASEWNAGTAISYSSLNAAKYKRWSREYERKVGPLGLTLTCHVFRHSFSVDFLAKNGNDYKALSEVLGHANAAITMNVYSHVSDGKAREYANRM